jgi:hypothetical protein
MRTRGHFGFATDGAYRFHDPGVIGRDDHALQRSRLTRLPPHSYNHRHPADMSKGLARKAR